MDFSIKTILKKLLSASMAGMYIGLGATAYMMIDNKFAGSFLFCVGIFLVMNYYNMLYTKVVPLSAFKDFSVRDIFITITGNIIGGTIYSFLISQTRIADKISEKMISTVDVKLNDNYISLFIMAVFCAVLVAYSSLCDRIYPDNKILSVIFTFLFIMAFVVVGFDHVVANVFYYSFYIFNKGYHSAMIPTFIAVLLGNTVGGLGTGYLELFRKKYCQTKTKA